MLFLQTEQSNMYVRQISLSGKDILFAVFVGTLRDLKEKIPTLYTHNYNFNERIPLYRKENIDSTASVIYYINKFNNRGEVKTFYRKIGNEDLHECIVLNIDLYNSIQNKKNNIRQESSYLYGLLKTDSLRDHMTIYEEERGYTHGFIRFSDLIKSEAFQDELFQQITLNCSVPLLKEWVKVLLDNTNKDNYSPDNFVYIYNDMRCYWDTETVDQVIAFKLSFRWDILERQISKLLREKKISFGNDITQGSISNVSSLQEYLNLFEDDLVTKAHNRFNPLYVPGISHHTETEECFFDNSKYFGNLNLFNAQKDVISSVALSLSRNKRTIIVGEMGIGKTVIAIGSVYAHNKKKNPISLIMCPGHLVEKWKTEIKRLYPFAQTSILSDIHDVMKWEKKINQKKTFAPLFLIVGKDTCKMDYEERPFLQWDEYDKTYYDPTAVRTLSRIIERQRPSKGHYDDSKYKWYNNRNGYIHPEAVTFFAKQNSKNRYVQVDKEKTGEGKTRKLLTNRSKKEQVESIWTAANPDNGSEWVKVADVGWINTKVAQQFKKQCDDRVKSGSELNKEELKAYVAANAALQDQVSIGIRRCNIADYIKRRIHLDYFIADEVHLYSSKDTAQGQAFGSFLSAADYSIALTGTLLNGYAQNIYPMLFRMYPDSFIKNGYSYSSSSTFSDLYGVVETTEEYYDAYRNGLYPKKKTEKYKPGVSPLLFSKFLLDKAVFVTLTDITSDLPDYTEIPIGVDMDLHTKEGYTDFYERSQKVIANDPKNLEKYIFKIVQRMNLYPDQPYDQIPIFNNDTGQQIICPNNIPNKDHFYSMKDLKTLELAQKHIEKKEKVLIYVNWVDASDCVQRLQRLFKENHISTAFLTASVPSRKREQWIKDKIKEGIDVMICNPSLVETGLDLLDFTTIIFYQTGYNLFTMRQASRRSLRLNQSKDVTVYFLYFKDTIQESVISLMANKLQAAMAIEGKFTDEGLNTLSENDTVLTLLANNLAKNIEVKLEDGAFDFHTIKAQRSGNRFKLKEDTLLKNWYFAKDIPAKKAAVTINLPEMLRLSA